ncbi:nestin [Lagopus muta]|uniref:nestin n=1 Tax=Lagopus muta TaxID=64668 RepID=UPI0020A0CF1E|nr:nestin [Lagopus muta]
MLSMEGFVGARALGEESLQMWDLNKRLEAYLARVKYLEEENEGLRAEIQSTKESPAGDPRRARYEEELRSLRDALHRAFTEKCAAELARDNLYEEVQHVRSRCQKEQAAREEAKRQLSSSKKELEEERRAQIWLKERAVQLEKEVESLLEVHEEEKAGLDQELASFSQSLEGFRCAPVAFQPVEVEDYSKRLSEIWRGAVETYKAEVAQLERALGQAKENLWQVAEDNQQSQLQLRHLEKELVGLKVRKEMLEESLGQQWQEQHGEAEKFQLAIEALEQEKQSLQVQIAQVLEDRQQLMHLKMSLSLEVATYRTLLEAESTRLQMPPGEFKLANSLRDVKLEVSSSKHRASLAAFPRPEGVAQLCRTPGDALKALTPKNKSSSAQEFQKINSVLQAPRSWEPAAPSHAVPVLSPVPGSGGAESPAHECGAGEESPMQSPLSPEQLVSHALQDALKEMQDDAEAKEVPKFSATQSTRDGDLEDPMEEEAAGTQEMGVEGGTVSPPGLRLCSNVPTLLSATQSDAESREEKWEEERSKEEEMLNPLSSTESQEPGGEPWGGDTKGSRLEVGKEDMEATSMEALHVLEYKEQREPWSPSREDEECEFPDQEREMQEEGSLQTEIEAACAVPVGSHPVLPAGIHLQEDFVETELKSEHQEMSLRELGAAAGDEREQEVCLEMSASSIEGAMPAAEGSSESGEDTTGRESTGRAQDDEGEEEDKGREALGGEDPQAGEALGAKEIRQESMGLEEAEGMWEESVDMWEEHRDPQEGHGDLQEEKEDLGEEHRDLQEEHGDLQEEYRDLQEEHGDLQEEHGDTQEEHGDLQEEYRDLQEEHGDTQEEHGDTQEEHGDLQEEYRDLQEEHGDLQEEYRDLQEEHGDTQEEHGDLQEEYRDLQEEHGDLQEEYRDLQEEHGDTQEEHGDLQEEYRDLQEKHGDTQEEHGDTQEEHGDLQEEYRDLQEEHGDLQEEQGDTQDEHGDTQEEHGDLKEEFRDLQEEHGDLQEEYRDLQEEHGDTQEEHGDLQVEHGDTHEEHGDLQVEHRDTQEEHGDLQKEYGDTQEEHRDLQKEHRDLQQEHGDLWEEHEVLKEEQEDLQEEHRDLQEGSGDPQEEPGEPWVQCEEQGSAEDGLEQEMVLQPGEGAQGREENDIDQKQQAQDWEETAEDEEETEVNAVTSQEPAQVDDNTHAEAAEDEEGDVTSPTATEEAQEGEDDRDAGSEVKSQQQPQGIVGQEAEPAPGQEEIRYGDTGEAPGDPQEPAEALEVQDEELSSEPIERGSPDTAVLQQDLGSGVESDEPMKEDIQSEDAQLDEPKPCRMELEDTLLNSTPLCAHSGEVLESDPNPPSSGGDGETEPEMALEEEGELRGSDEAAVHAEPESCEESGMELSSAPECTEEEEGYFIVSAPNQEESSIEEAENSEEFEEIKVEAEEDRKDELTVPAEASPVLEDEGHLEPLGGEAEDVKMPTGELEIPKEEDEEDAGRLAAELEEGLAVSVDEGLSEGRTDKTILGDEGLGEEDVQDSDNSPAPETSNTDPSNVDPPPGTMLEHGSGMEAAQYLPDVPTQMPVDIMKDSDILEIVEQALEFNQELVMGAKLAKDGEGDGDTQLPQEEEGGSSPTSSSDEQPTVQEAVAEPERTKNGEQNGLHRQASLEDLAEFTEEGLNGITHPEEAPAAHTLPLPSKHSGAEPVPPLSPLQDQVLHPEQEPWSSGEE